MKRLILISIILIPQLLWAQDAISGYTPANPVSGSEMTVWYNPNHPKAALSPRETIFASVTFMSDMKFDYHRRQYTMEPDGERFSVKIPIPDDCMKITLYYYTASTSRFDWAGLEIEVYNKSGIPIKDQYPAYGYRSKWFPYSFLFGEDTASMMILDEIKEVEKLRDKDPLGVAYSLAYGFMLAGEEAKSRFEIKGLLEKYPGHQLAYQSLTSYSYLVYAGKIDNPEGADEVDSLQLDLVTKYPDRRFAQMYLTSSDTRNMSLELIERICRNWMHVEPGNAQPYIRLAGRYNDEGIYPRKVIGLAEKGIELLLDPLNRIYLDLKGSMTRTYLSLLSSYEATAWVQLGEYCKAISAAVKANAYMASASNMLLEGQIWIGLENYFEAEKVLIEAMKLGSGEAEYELKKVYDIYDRSGKSEVKPDAPSAPDFNVTTLDGKKLSLKSLKGKILVLNFWTLGCGPCRAEMPELNKLVERYKDDEVVFIAFSSDQRMRLNEFFKKKAFDYNQVSDARDLFKKFGIKVLPTHVIINSKGAIHHRMTGAGKQNYENLSNMINYLLK